MTSPVPRDTPIRLRDAAARYGVTIASLRSAGKSGRLVMLRFAGKDWTTDEAVREMFARCRVSPEAPDYGSGRSENAPTAASPNPSGSSSTERDRLALEAARANVQRLKNGLPPISPGNTRPRGESATLMKFPSPT